MLSKRYGKPHPDLDAFRDAYRKEVQDKHLAVVQRKLDITEHPWVALLPQVVAESIVYFVTIREQQRAAATCSTWRKLFDVMHEKTVNNDVTKTEWSRIRERRREEAKLRQADYLMPACMEALAALEIRFEIVKSSQHTLQVFRHDKGWQELLGRHLGPSCLIHANGRYYELHIRDKMNDEECAIGKQEKSCLTLAQLMAEVAAFCFGV